MERQTGNQWTKPTHDKHENQGYATILWEHVEGLITQPEEAFKKV